MGFGIEISENTITKTDQVAKWYDSQEGGLGQSFKAVLKEKLNQIQDNPEIFTEVKQNQRRALLGSSFPYTIHYTINKETQKVIIAGVFHQHKNPKLIQQQLRLERLQEIRRKREQAQELCLKQDIDRGLRP